MTTIDFSGIVSSVNNQEDHLIVLADDKKKIEDEERTSMSTLSDQDQTITTDVSSSCNNNNKVVKKPTSNTTTKRSTARSGRRRVASLSPPRSQLSPKRETRGSGGYVLRSSSSSSKRERRRVNSFSPPRSTKVTSSSSSKVKAKSSGYIQPLTWDMSPTPTGGDEGSPRYYPKGMSAADIFYAQLNGETLAPSGVGATAPTEEDNDISGYGDDDDVDIPVSTTTTPRMSPRGSIIIQDMSVLELHQNDRDDDDEDDEEEWEEEEEYCEFEIDCTFPTEDSEGGEDDNDSFADLEFPDNSSWAETATRASRNTNASSKKKRRKKKKNGEKKRSSSSSSSTGSLTSFDSNLSGGTSVGSHSSMNEGADKITIREIEESILQHLPAEVQGNIPDHVWKKIFRRSLVLETEAAAEEQALTKLATGRRSSCLKIKIDDTSTPEGASQEMTPTTTPPVVKEVRFNYVQVRYYERILDNNPAVSSGPAIAIGWRYKRGRRLTVDDWELQNPYEDRLSLTPCVLSRHQREHLLKEWGYKQKQIATATRSILKAKNARKVTVQNLGSQRMEETVENTARCVKGLLRGRFLNANKKALY